MNFYEIAKPYTHSGTGTALRDPSLMYYSGKYWMINGTTEYNSSENANRYKIRWGVSTSLATGGWSNIASGSDGSSNNRISFSGQYPYKYNGEYGNTTFDVYAPDLFVDGSSVYIVLSAGYAGSFHGGSGWDDVMKPYLVPVTSLSYNNGQISAQFGTPRKIDLPSNSRLADERAQMRKEDHGNQHNIEDRIDGTLYKEGGYYYFVVKRYGTAVELWRIDNLNNVSSPNSWELLNSDLVDQFEGASLVKYGSNYLVYTDKLEIAKEYPDGQRGIYVSVTNSLSNGSKWKRPQKVKICDPSHPNGGVIRRHGTVMLITNQTEVNKIVNLFNAKHYNRTGDYGLDTNMSNGWFRSDGMKYYCTNGTWAASTEKQIDGYWYWFDADGTMARNKFVYIASQNKWAYYGDDGRMLYGEQQLGSQYKYVPLRNDTKYWYYFDPVTGKEAVNCWITLPDGRRCHYDSNGHRDQVQL